MADNKRAVGSVTYRDAEHGYFERRKLRRHAAFWSLWALGVGAVISGDFYGWNLGLDAGGFGGLLIAGIVITIMYYGLCYSIAEMSPALPHTGGAYSFSRSAMGPWGGFITGLAENMEYVITPAVVVGAMGFLSHDIVFDLTGADGWWNSPVLWWAIYYIIFVGINILGIEITMRFTVVITAAALGILGFFFLAVIFTGSFDASLLTNIPPEEGGSSFLPKGIAGIFPALPFAIWFYLAIEELPLAAEESHDPKRDIPRATIWGLNTLVLFAVLTLFLNTGVGGGAATIGTSATPLFDGFKAVFGEGTAASVLALIGLIGLIASFFTIIYAYGRNTYSLSRAGYFPQEPVDHPPDQKHAVRRADRRRGCRVRPRAGDLLPRTERERTRGQDRRRAAVHGRVRCRDLLLHAVPGVHHAAPQAAEHRAAVPQPGGRLGRRGGGCDRAGCAHLALPQRGLPARCRRNAHLLPDRNRSTSRSPGGTSWCCRRKRSSRLSQGQYGVNLEQEGYGAVSVTEIATEDTPTRSP